MDPNYVGYQGSAEQEDINCMIFTQNIYHIFSQASELPYL